MSDDTSKLLPEGYYDAVAVETSDEDGGRAYARFAYTKSEAREVAAHFRILNAPPHGSGFPLPWYGFFTPDSAKRTCESLRYMGLKGDDLAAAETQKLDQIVSVKVEHNTWEGKTLARVAFVNAPGGGTVKLNNPMTRDQVRQFAAMMRQSMAKLPDVDGERATPSTAQTEAPSNNAGVPPVEPDGFDDLPF